MPRLRIGDVVVITGASSGIGRSTALAFAERKSRLVLAARSLEKLRKVARECEALGAEVLIVETDVRETSQIDGLKTKALERFKTIDVWINNAGISAIGDFTDVQLKDHLDVLATNLGGYVASAHAAMTVFREKKRGTLIQIGSVNSEIAVPGLSSYVTSKFAIRGLTHALRQDLRLSRLKDIHVCQVSPSVIDTPAFDHSKNATGKELKLNLPKAKPEDVARAIVGLVDRPRREVYVGLFSRLGTFTYSLFPDLTGAVVTWMMRKFYFGDD
jgi:short-subunit dehydrogenase